MLKSVGPNGTAVTEGQEYLLPQGAPGVTQGARLNIEVTREALGGAEPWKRPLARMTDQPARPAPSLEGREAISGEFDEAGWPDLVEEARNGIVAFPGGELRVSLTPAMTLIDVDGQLSPAELAVAGARAAGQAIRRHGISGSIGIDLPTAESKDARQAAATVIDAILPQPFERTAVNGFGFLQIVRPRRHASLFELAADRAAFETRVLLRRVGREVGAIRVAAHPSVIAVLAAIGTGLTNWRGRLAALSPCAATPRSPSRADMPSALNPKPARCAASRLRPNTRHSAAVAARTATS